MTVRVLGVDPGLTRCGWGIVDVAADRSARLVAVGVVVTEAGMPLPRRLRTIADALEVLADEHRPQAIALEQVFAQHNVQSVMGVAQISGVVLVMAERRGLPVGMHTPSEVKAAVTGYGSADKAQVGAMVARILRLTAVPKPADAADALALALCHAWRAGATVPASARSAADGAAAAGTSRTPAGPALTPAQQRWLAAERSRRPGAARPRLDP